MKKITILLVIIFTFLFSTTSWGEWILVLENDSKGKFYYDKDRVRKSGKFLYVWTLEDYLMYGGSLIGTKSVTEYVQLDCSIFRYKILEYKTYKNKGGEGEINNEGGFCCYTISGEDVVLNKWIYPQRKSEKEILFNKVCEEHQ